MLINIQICSRDIDKAAWARRSLCIAPFTLRSENCPKNTWKLWLKMLNFNQAVVNWAIHIALRYKCRFLVWIILKRFQSNYFIIILTNYICSFDTTCDRKYITEVTPGVTHTKLYTTGSEPSMRWSSASVNTFRVSQRASKQSATAIRHARSIARRSEPLTFIVSRMKPQWQPDKYLDLKSRGIVVLKIVLIDVKRA